MQVLNPLSLTQRRMPNKETLVGLSCFQRMLLVTDGTVTELLEQYLSEKIKVVKLYEKVENDINQVSNGHEAFTCHRDSPILQRKVLLQGQSTSSNCIYAESTIFLNHLVKEFRLDLLASREPIGRLWEKYQLETYKIILDFGKKEAGALATHFAIQPEEMVISRTYSVYSGGKIIMLITESFPDTLFCH